MITPAFIAPPSADRSSPSADPVAGVLADGTPTEAPFDCLLTEAASTANVPAKVSVFAPIPDENLVSKTQPQSLPEDLPVTADVPAESPVAAQLPVTRSVRNVAARVMSHGADSPAVSADPVDGLSLGVKGSAQDMLSEKAGSPVASEATVRLDPTEASGEPPAGSRTGRDEPPAELLAMFALSRFIPAEPEAVAVGTATQESGMARASRASAAPFAPAARMRDHGPQPVSIFVGQASAETGATPDSRLAPTDLAATAPKPSPAGKPSDAPAPSLPVTTTFAVAAVETAPASASAVVLNTVRAPVVSEPAAASEKNAAAGIQSRAGSLEAKSGSGKNNFLSTVVKTDAERISARGTVNAKVSTDMPVVSKNSMHSVAPAAPAELASLPPAGLAGLPADTAVTEAVDASAPRATDAADAVRQVVDIIHEFRDRDRGSVEVKFDFADDAGLTVRVDLRGDELRTTFRTDSDELRAALGREWQGFAAGLANEARGHRVAEPVFTASGNDAGSQAGHDAHGRQNFSGHDQAAGRHSAFAGGATRSSAPVAPAAVPSATPRVSTDRLLQAFA